MPVVESLPPKSRPVVGPPAPLTDTVALSFAEPPAPVHVRVNVLLGLVSAPVLAVPDVAFEPLQAPLAVQLDALVDDQVRLELPPDATVVGVAEINTVGAGVDVVTVTVAD